jgi:effector-binding domain-containing protein
MINPHDHIRYSNVVSMKYHFHYNDMQDVIKDFIMTLTKQNVTLKGPLFYSINNVPLDEKINGEFFMPIQEESLELLEDICFHSYYSIEDMVSLTLHNNIEQETQIAYKLLLEHIEANNLQQATPIFHIVSGDHDFQYMMVKVGINKI